MADLSGATSSIATSTDFIDLSAFEKAQLTQLEGLNYSVNQLLQETMMSETYNEATDYSFISSIILLGIFILALFDFLRRHSSKL